MKQAWAFMLIAGCVAALACSGDGDGSKDGGAPGEAGSNEDSGGSGTSADGAVAGGGRGGSAALGESAGRGGQGEGGSDATVSNTDPDGSTSADMDSGSPPKPVDIDLTGLVPTSGRLYVFIARDLRTMQAIDVETGEVHDANPLAADAAMAVTSPDGTTVLYGGANAASDRNLYLARFTEDGFVPGKLVEGFEDMPGNHYGVGWSRTGDVWSQSQRFVGLERGSNLIGDGVDIVDTWRNTRHFTFDGDMTTSSANIHFAPMGDWFSFRMTLNDVSHSWYARVTDDGSSDPVQLPEHQVVDAFTHDGTKLIIAERPVGDPSGPRRYFARDLATGDDTDIETEVAGEDFMSINGYEPNGYVRGFYVVDAATEHYVYRRIALDNSMPPMAVSDRARRVDRGVTTPDGSLMLFTYATDTQIEMELTNGQGEQRTEHAQFALDADLQLGGYGDRFLYYFSRPGDFHLVARASNDDVIDTVVNTTDATGYGCLSTVDGTLPPDKLVVLETGSDTLSMIDLSEDAARHVGTFTPQHGGKFYCPTWDAQGHAFALVEHDSDVGTVFYVVDWPAAGPAEPREFHRTDHQLYGTVLLTP